MSRIAYFECREDNHNKFYLMTEDPTGTTFVARWGRIGTEGRFCAYSISNWNKELHERLSHGYVDRTQDYLDGKINGPAAWTGVGEAKYKMSGIRKIWLGHSLICDSAIVNGIVRGYATVAEKANVRKGTLVEGDTYYIQS